MFRDAVRHDANLFDISLVLLCTGTEIFDLALATAVLIAAYMTLLRMRENREFLALFASGLGPYQLGALVVIVSLVAQLAGLAGGGIVDPVSRYAQRSILFSTELHPEKRPGTGRILQFPQLCGVRHRTPRHAEHARGGCDRRQRRPAHHQSHAFHLSADRPHTARVITAAQASLTGPDRAGRIILDLNDFSSHTFADAHPLVGLSTAAVDNAAVLNALKEVPQITMHVRDMSRLMMVNQLLPFGSRGSDAAEQTVFEELAKRDSATPDLRAAQMRLLAERFASTSCLSWRRCWPWPACRSPPPAPTGSPCLWSVWR